MVKNVFSLNNVADFYNQNFINLKMHFERRKSLRKNMEQVVIRHSCLSMVTENWSIWRVGTRKVMSL